MRIHGRLAKRLTAVGGLCLGVGVALMAPAFACSTQPETWSTPAQAEPGAVVTVHGAYYQGIGMPVDIYWGGASSGTLMATATLDQDGGFSKSVTIPSNATAGETYLIQALRRDTASERRPQTANMSFKVAKASPAPAPAPAPVPAPAPQSETQAPVVDQAPAAAPAAASAAAPQRTPAQSRPSPARASKAARSAPAATPAPVPAAETPAAVVPTALGPTEDGGGVVAPISGASLRTFGQAPVPDVPLGGSSGPSPWLLVPLAAMAIGLFSLGSAVVANDVRRRKVGARL